jgi:pimeloyl-ACP methyl ester carboxylesterase
MIAYDDLGHGDALLLVHGHPFDRTMWRPQAERYSRAGWRVIVPDLRGYGESTVGPGKTTLDVFARDITGLLDRLGVDTFVVGGLSMGGQIVMELHRQVPERIRGLILADTSALADTGAARRTRLDTAERLTREGMGPYAEELLPKMVAPHNITALPDVAEHVLTMMRGANPEGASAALRGRAERPDYTESLTQVGVPALVVVGSDDEFTPIGDAKHIADHIANARLVVIDGAAHLPNLERTAEFDAAVLSFLDTIGGAR